MRRETRPAVLVLVVTFVLTLVLVVSPVLAASFADITSDTYDNPDYPEAVSALSDLGIVSGFDDGSFRPHDPVTRQQFAKMIVKLSGYPVTGAEVCPFSDVSKTPSAADPLYPASYVAVCAGLGIAKGVDATHFAPYKNITRAQAVTMLVRMAQQIGVPLQAPTEAYYAGLVPNSLFHNVDDPVHGANIQVAEMNNLLWGLWPDTGNRWNIYGKATRGEVAHIMYRLWQRMNGATYDHDDRAVDYDDHDAATTTSTTDRPRRPRLLDHDELLHDDHRGRQHDHDRLRDQAPLQRQLLQTKRAAGPWACRTGCRLSTRTAPT